MPSLKLPSGRLRLETRRLYGADPVGYEAGRPEYPERVYELLRDRCGRVPGAEVLEIGPGTGRVTRRLVGFGARVVAVEPDARLTAYLQERVLGSDVKVVEGTFEGADLIEDHFDLAVAAMSFHWVDKECGIPKLGRVVRSGGWVALWWTLFGDPTRPDPFRDATQHLLESPTPDTSGPGRVPFELDEAGWRHDLGQRGGLVDVEAELIRWTARFDPQELRAFYASLIGVRPVRQMYRRCFSTSSCRMPSQTSAAVLSALS